MYVRIQLYVLVYNLATCICMYVCTEARDYHAYFYIYLLYYAQYYACKMLSLTVLLEYIHLY